MTQTPLASLARASLRALLIRLEPVDCDCPPFLRCPCEQSCPHGTDCIHCREECDCLPCVYQEPCVHVRETVSVADLLRVEQWYATLPTDRPAVTFLDKLVALWLWCDRDEYACRPLPLPDTECADAESRVLLMTAREASGLGLWHPLDFSRRRTSGLAVETERGRNGSIKEKEVIRA